MYIYILVIVDTRDTWAFFRGCNVVCSYPHSTCRSFSWRDMAPSLAGWTRTRAESWKWMNSKAP